MYSKKYLETKIVNNEVPNADGTEFLEFRERRNSCRLKQLLEEKGTELYF